MLRARISEIQADRKKIYRQVGETLSRIWREVEETTLAKSRRALFGEDISEVFDILQNRFLFVEGGNDEYLFLEYYILLGNFINDPDRFEVFDSLLLDFISGFILADDNAEELSKARKTSERLLEQARLLRSELARLEEERDELSSRTGEKNDTFPRIFQRKTGTPVEAQNELDVVRRKSETLAKNLGELAPLIEAAKQRVDFLMEENQNRSGDFLNQPANARRVFDPAFSGTGDSTAETRARLLEEWVHRLEERDLLFHVLASYELPSIYAEYCPPIHLQQLKKAIVYREEAQRVEQILEQFPARKISVRRLEEASRAIRRRTHEETLRTGLQFAEDLGGDSGATAVTTSRSSPEWTELTWSGPRNPASFRGRTRVSTNFCIPRKIVPRTTR